MEVVPLIYIVSASEFPGAVFDAASGKWHGNTPESRLECSAEWDGVPGEFVKCCPVWRDRATGEEVKRSAHVLAIAPPAMGAEQGTFGG